MKVYVVSTIDSDSVMALTDTAVFSTYKKAKNYVLEQVKVYNDNGLFEGEFSEDNDYWWNLQSDGGSTVDIFIDEKPIK